MVKSERPLDLTVKKRRRKGPQSFSCPYDGCHKSFTKKLYLECHIRVHTREQPFECTQCTPPKKFSDKSNLKRHIQATHLKVKRFGCSRCGKHFAQSSNLKAHMLIHSGQKQFACETCDKRFSRKDHLSFHSSKCVEKINKKLSALEKKNKRNKVIQSTLNFPIQKKTRISKKLKIDPEITTTSPIITTTASTSTKIENIMDQERVQVDEKTIEYLKRYTNEDQIVPDSVFEEHGITVIEVTAVEMENDDVVPVFVDDNNNNTPVKEEIQNSNNNNDDNDNIIMKVDIADHSDQVVPLMPYQGLESMSPDDELFYQDVALNVTISQESEGVQQMREIYNINNNSNNNNNHNAVLQQNSPFLPFQYLLNSLPALIPVGGQTLSQELNLSTRYSSFSSQNQINGSSSMFTVFSPPTFN